jgi:chloride channel protein, CIC family
MDAGTPTAYPAHPATDARHAGQRLLNWVRASPAGLVTLALTVGLGAGLGAILFRYLILWFTLAFTGHAEYGSQGTLENPWVPWLGRWFVIAAPVAGGLLYGPLVWWGAREARGHGVPEVMRAVAEFGGRIRPRVAAVKSLASALCIGSGGSVGREGPIVQIGSAIGSTIGQALHVSESRLRLLVACGAAGGISATFNAPIAGAMFALELILRDFEADSFGAVVVASVSSDAIGRAAFGSHAFLTLPHFELTSNWEYLSYMGLGLLAAAAGVGFFRALYRTEDLVDRFWRGPEWLRPGAGGALLGLLLVALPEMYGVGYPALERAVGGAYAGWFLLLLLLGKVMATSLTIAIGGSGGVFAPSLFIGAMLGTSYGQLVTHLFPGVDGSAGAYGLVGMGAVFAAAARAPITSALIIFELTGEYRIILPLLLAIAVSTSVANFVTRDTIYTLKLERLGVHIGQGMSRLMQLIRVGDAMLPIPAPLRPTDSIGEALRRFTADGLDALPILDRSDRYLGTVTSRGVEEALHGGEATASIGHLMENTPTVTVRQSLEQALGILLPQATLGVPVLDEERVNIVGWLDHRAILLAYQSMLSSKAPPRTRAGGRIKPASLRME